MGVTINTMAKPLETKAAAVYDYSNTLANRFTRVDKFGETYFAYRKVGDYIFLPREACPVSHNDNRVDGQPVKFNLNWQPRTQDQFDWVMESLTFLKAGKSGISEAPTGFGKTACSMPVIAAVQRKTLIVCTKEDLLLGDDQWYGSLKKFLNLQDHEIGFVRGDRCDVQGKKVVLSLIQSLAKENRYPPGTFDDFGLMITDETHRVAADFFSNIMFLVPALRRWGLSATPNRSDGKDDLLRENIGPVRVRATQMKLVPKVLHIKSNWRCPRVVKTNKLTGEKTVKRYPHMPGRIMGVLKFIVNDPARNSVLVDAAMMGYSKKRHHVMFTELVDHINILHGLLIERGIPASDIGIYKGGMKEEARKAAVKRPITLTTYRMTSEGTNVPRWDMATFCTPRGDVIQIAGRILREHPDKSNPVIVDVTDADSPVFKGYAWNRRVWYQKIGAEQIDLT